jgi:hypothetical protein
MTAQEDFEELEKAIDDFIKTFLKETGIKKVVDRTEKIIDWILRKL